MCILYYEQRRFYTTLEYKKFTKHESPTTLFGMELPVNNGGYDYPPFQETDKNIEVFQLYAKSYSIGRAGSYLYGIDIDDCIKQAMIMADQLRRDSQDYAVPGEQYGFQLKRSEMNEDANLLVFSCYCICGNHNANH